MPTLLQLKIGALVTLIVAWAFTVAALFTPAWRNLDSDNSVGLVTYHCSSTACNSFKNNVPDWSSTCKDLNIAAAVGMTIKLIVSLVTWNKTKSKCMSVLKVLVCLIAIAKLLVLLILYAIKSDDYFGSGGAFQYSTVATATATSHSGTSLGYSYWFALVAAVFMVFSTGFSIVEPCIAK
ncbi:unnamed protein product [Bursaphelenchus okinawaensis]|uniref:Uncharacterized protein n=1 Tax=Bursaphelenchus okinawaensis TaxID=465554 RepID=A0A811JVT4_9BILA|nr:unnamed protein product [Bursaphelenchus okinawaensis]CAG9084703.1 unnamed protein product [Bursaphelenchus okinawaensis]